MSAIVRNAHRFMLFREGSAVGWDCTATDLSCATGLPLRTVSKICNSDSWRHRGWFPRLSAEESQQRSGAQQHGLDAIIAMPEGSRMRARYDY